jgi:hypothetical protein
MFQLFNRADGFIHFLNEVHPLDRVTVIQGRGGGELCGTRPHCVDKELGGGAANRK